MRKRARRTFIKVSARVTLADYRRLDKVRELYGFRSVYQIMNYLTYSFLRVADREHDVVDEPVPDEIEDMFKDLSEGQLPIKYRKARPYKRPSDL